MKYINKKINELINLINDIEEQKLTLDVEKDYIKINTCDMLIREYISQLKHLKFIIGQ